MQRRRGEFTSLGPNQVWSIDGHCKLEPYGIEVYAAVDAYSRMVIWIYVGVTARTQVSCGKQFLEVALSRKVVPDIIRSDRGAETALIAGAQWELHRFDSQYDIPLSDCYIFGTSTANVRVESWWGQLSKSATFKYKVNL